MQFKKLLLSTHAGGNVVRKFWLAFNFCRKKQSPIQSGRDSKQLLFAKKKQRMLHFVTKSVEKLQCRLTLHSSY